MCAVGVCVSVPLRHAPLIRPTIRFILEQICHMRWRAEGDERPVAG